jgi:hypothetical protein
MQSADDETQAHHDEAIKIALDVVSWAESFVP